MSIGEKYRQRLRLIIGLVLGIAAVAVLLNLLCGGGVRAGLVTGAGGAVCYLYVEWFHYLMHHRSPRTALERYLWRHHYAHHYRDGRFNFGFTSPLWDFFLGTYKAAPQIIVVPDAQAPPGLELVPGFRVVGREPER